MSTTQKSEGNPFARIEAYITALEDGPDAGLALLPEDQRDEVVAARVTILHRAERFEDVASLIESRQPDTRWCDRAIYALVRVGRRAKADELLAWARDNAPVPLRHLCALRYGEALMAELFKFGKQSDDVDFAPKEKSFAEDVLNVIRPLVEVTLANNAVQSELEERTLLLALEANLRLHRDEECKRLSGLLLQRKPVPVGLGKLALFEIIPTPPNLPDRLRAEHVGTDDAFVAGLLAADLEAKHLGRSEQAFWAACALEPLAKSVEDRKELWRHLRGFVGAAGAGAQAAFDGITQRLIEGNSRDAAKHRIEVLAQQGDLVAAEAELLSITDETDPEWLQLRGKLQWAQGNKPAALDTLIRAARLFPHVDLLRDVGALALKEKRADIAEEMLGRVINNYPHDRMARHNLAMLMVSQDRFADAIPHYEVLRRDHPQDEQYGLNLAASLTLLQRPKEALVVFESLCGDDCSASVLMARAQLLRSLNEPKTAFASLTPARARFWDNVAFVGEYMNLAYAAGEERLAHEAFVQLRSLQTRGIAGPEILQEKTLEDMTRMMEAVRERDETLMTDLLLGKIGWIVVESARNTDPSIAWAMRTQAVKWLHEDPLFRAAYTLYATNSYRVRPGPEGAQLVGLEAAPQGASVVADVSALITLDRLGLLDIALGYLGPIQVPAVYAYLAMDEATHLVHHQWSSVELQDQLLALSTEHQINTVSAAEAAGLPHLDEHGAETEVAYRLADVEALLFGAGRLDQGQHDDFTRLAHKPATGTIRDRALDIGQRLVVSYSTLSTLHFLGWLPVVAQSFRLLLEQRDRDLLNAETSNRRFRENVRDWSGTLWRRVISDSRFVQTTHLRPGEILETEERQRPGKAAIVASILLAEKLDLPLLADDRFLQQALLNRRTDRPAAAFGTDVLLGALRDAAMIDKNRHADAIVQLLEWRYRFIVPDSTVLKTLADRNRLHAPTLALRRIAVQMHDAMRDPGLLTGFEQTDPPSTCGNKFYQEWTAALAEFVVAVWADEAYSAESAEHITEWVAGECLPTTATRFGPTERLLANHVMHSFLSHIGIRSALERDLKRAKQMVNVLQDALALERPEYLEIVGDLINAGHDRE